MQQLIEVGADLNLATIEEVIPVLVASQLGYSTVVWTLIEASTEAN